MAKDAQVPEKNKKNWKQGVSGTYRKGQLVTSVELQVIGEVVMVITIPVVVVGIMMVATLSVAVI